MFCGHRLHWSLVAVLVVSVVALVGCGKKSDSEKQAETMMEKTLEHATGGDVDVDLGGGGDVTVKTEEGTTTMSETTEWPADMFSEVPRFTYGVIERVTRSEQTHDSQKSVMIYFRDLQNGGPEKYGKEIEAAGWQSQMNMAAGKGGMISAQKGNLALTLTYNYEDRMAVLNVFSGADE